MTIDQNALAQSRMSFDVPQFNEPANFLQSSHAQ